MRVIAEAARNLAAGFLLEALASWKAGDQTNHDRCVLIAARYEREADRIQQAEERACCCV